MIVSAEFLTTLKVACNVLSAFGPNNNLYFTGLYTISSETFLYVLRVGSYAVRNAAVVGDAGAVPTCPLKIHCLNSVSYAVVKICRSIKLLTEGSIRLSYLAACS